MSWADRLERIHAVVDGRTGPTSAFVVPGQSPTPADRWAAAHDQILLSNPSIVAGTLTPDDFTKLQLLGEGQFATVRLA